MTTVHDVFHDCCLKAYSDDGRTQPPPILELLDDEPESEVDLRRIRSDAL